MLRCPAVREIERTAEVVLQLLFLLGGQTQVSRFQLTKAELTGEKAEIPFTVTTDAIQDVSQALRECDLPVESFITSIALVQTLSSGKSSFVIEC